MLASYTPSKAYNSVVISTEALTVGGTYTVTAGSYSETVTLTSLIYGGGMGMGGFGGMGGPMGGQPGGGFGGGPGGQGGGPGWGGPGRP